jgi:hypothetical protein
MDFVSGAKNVGTSAFGASSSSSGATGAGGGMFSNIQKIVLLLAIIAFVISVGTVGILLWKSKSSQKWPPEISKGPDRMELDTNNLCKDTYGLYTGNIQPNDNNCINFNTVKGSKYNGDGLSGIDNGYIPWEGVVDGAGSRSSSLKC